MSAKAETASERLAKNFADWEGGVFGFGYGTGEPHTTAALRSFLALCAGANGGYDYQTLERGLTPIVAWLLISALVHADIIEYGTSPRFGWLTPQGRALRRFVMANTTDALLEMLDRTDAADICSRHTCNCGPRGYEQGRVCVNPFWQEDAARKFLEGQVSASQPNGDGIQK